MKRTVHTVLSLLMCLSLILTGILSSYTVDGAYQSGEAHNHTDGAVPLAATAPAAAVETDKTFVKENGITIVLRLISGHFNGVSYLCENPDAIIITANDNISSVTFYKGEYLKENGYSLSRGGVISPAQLDGINTTSVTAKLPEGTVGSVIISVTAGGTTLEDKSFNINHMLGGRDTVEFAATCLKPARKETQYFCKICGAMYDSYETGKVDEALGHEFVDEVVENTCEGTSVTYEKCTRCGFIKLKDGSSVDESKHSFNGAKTVIESTCHNDGVEYLKCDNCGVIKADSVKSINAKNHVFAGRNDPMTKYVEPTCTEWGYYERHCKNDGCDAVDINRSKYPLGHNWVLDGDYTVKPSCDSEGIGNVKCSRCNATETGHKFPGGVHNYVYKLIVEPTCTTDGYWGYVCENCGQEKPNSIKKIEPKLGHVAGADDNDCTTPVMCTRCGEIAVPAKEHSFNSRYQNDSTYHWSVCTNPGCTQINEKELHKRLPGDTGDCDTGYVCTICHKQIPRSAHVYEEGKYTVENNLYHTQKCKICGKVISEMHTIIHDNNCSTDDACALCGHVCDWDKAKQHSFANWVDEGETHVSYCTNAGCNFEQRESHTFGSSPKEIVENKKESCTESGSYTDVYVCTAEGCNATKKVERTVQALDHSYGDWMDESPSQCESAGRQYRVCSSCGFIEYKELPASGHVWDSGFTVDKEATCLEEGIQSVHCSVCGTRKEITTIPKSDHKYGENVSRTIPATCTDPGANIYKCTVCNEEKFVEIPASGHTYGEYKYNEDATCQKPGTKSRQCAVESCGAIDTVLDEEHPQTDHKFTVWAAYEDATIEKNATEISNCDYGCGETSVRDIEGTKLHNHTFTNYVIVKEATCTENAYQQAKCDICGTPSELVEVKGTALNHTDDVPVIKTPAGCTSDAVMTVSCARCHVILREWREPDTATGHRFTNYVYNNDATDDADGTETAVCDNGCGESDTRPAPGTKLEGEHKFTKYTYNNDAGCYNGTETAYCDNGCGTSHTREKSGTALGHIYSEPVIKTPATCTDDAIGLYTCTRTPNGCGETIEAAIPGTATGHESDDGIVTKEPTETENGEKVYRCKKCQIVLRTEILPYKGHITNVVTDSAPKTSVSAADIKSLEDEVLTDDDRDAIDAGFEVKIVLSITDAEDTVSPEDVAAISEVSDEYTVSQYLDIELAKYIDGVPIDIHELENPITLVIDVPEALRGVSGRKFAVVRVHEGKAEILTDTDSNPDTISVKTDSFSTYAIIYLDAKWEHQHVAGGWRFDRNYHWINCEYCGTTLELAKHVFVNGECVVCGYGTQKEPSETVDDTVVVDTPTEGKHIVSSCEK